MQRFHIYLVWSTDIDIAPAVNIREAGLQPAVQNTYSYA